MKLLITIVQDQDVPKLLEKLTEKNIGATKLASTGGFLRVGNTTVLIGVDDEKVDGVLEIIKETCEKRDQFHAAPVSPFGRGGVLPRPTKVVVGGATVFIVEIERFEKI